MIAPPREPALRLAFEIAADISPQIHVGRSPREVVAFTPVVGGTVEGPRLQGSILAGGGDWSTDRDGIFELDARYLIRAHDGAAIEIRNRGIARASDEVFAAIGDGREASLDDVYFRTAPTFRTDAPAHAWLTRSTFLGIGRLFGPSRIVLSIHEVI